MKDKMLRIVGDHRCVPGDGPLAALLRTLGIPPHTRTVHVDFHGYDPIEKTMQMTARPARRGSKPIVEHLEIHWPL